MNANDRPSMEEIHDAVRRLARARRRRRRALKALTACLTLAALLLCLSCTVARPYRVEGDAMSPTLEKGQVVLVNGLNRKPGRGDVMVSGERAPDGGQLIRRVIAVAGDTVSVSADTGEVTLNGTVIKSESYVSALSPGNGDTGETTVPEGYVYVLGDNRATALDSRSSTVGLLPVDTLEGKAWCVCWPEWRTLP